MDYEAIDRAASRAIVKLTDNTTGTVLYLADNAMESATDIPANVKRFNWIGAAWEAADRARETFSGFTVEAVSVVELWNR